MKKLSVRTFALLVTLSLAVLMIILFCICIALPYVGQSRSQDLLDVETAWLLARFIYLAVGVVILMINSAFRSKVKRA